jgi:geranylgeranyl pyrophosphate synthase
MDDWQQSKLKRAFTDFLPVPPNLEPQLKHALDRVLNNPGSLIRPEIALEIALGYGLPETTATEIAVRLEHFHTTSLLFDDLPSR